MNVHEYQAKQLLSKYGVPIKEGTVATTPGEAGKAAEHLLASGHTRVVIKAQIHAGGRGKGTFKNGRQGGIKLAESIDEAVDFAGGMLGQILVTRQTGPEGKQVKKVLIEPATEILQEYYVAVLLDRNLSRPVVMASSEGGVDIEEVAASAPEKIVREIVDPALGLMPFQARRLAIALGLREGMIHKAAKLFQGVYRTWWEGDASLVEINPLALVEEPDGSQSLCVIDAKIGLDDNGLARHKKIQSMRDLAEEAPLEIEASKHDLNYIQLDGNIACLVNGAGLAMATMDIIQHYGGRPANFLDVGGGASVDQVTGAFTIILQDPNVQAILINIFGGIMDCDVIAHGLVAAAQKTSLTLPLVVRLEGNNVQAARATLSASELSIINGDSMADAAQKAVEAAGTKISNS